MTKRPHLSQTVKKYWQVHVEIKSCRPDLPTDRVTVGAVIYANGQISSHVVLAKQRRRYCPPTPRACDGEETAILKDRRNNKELCAGV